MYGGFGEMIAMALLIALQLPALRAGVLVAVAAALGGMAVGRVVSAVIGRVIDKGRCAISSLRR